MFTLYTVHWAYSLFCPKSIYSKHNVSISNKITPVNITHHENNLLIKLVDNTLSYKYKCLIYK